MKFNLALAALIGQTIAAPVLPRAAEADAELERRKLGDKGIAFLGAGLGTIGGWSAPVFNRFLNDRFGVQTPATTKNPNDKNEKRDADADADAWMEILSPQKRDALGPKGLAFLSAGLGTVGGWTAPVFNRFLNDKFGVQTPATTKNPNDKNEKRDADADADADALMEILSLQKRDALGPKGIAALGAGLSTLGGLSGPVFNRWLNDKFGVQTPATTKNPNDKNEKRDVDTVEDFLDLVKRDPLGPKGLAFLSAGLGTVGGLSAPVFNRWLNDNFGVQTPATTKNPNDKNEKRDVDTVDDFLDLVKRDPLGPKGLAFLSAGLGTVGGLSAPVFNRWLNDKFGVQTPATTKNPNDKNEKRDAVSDLSGRELNAYNQLNELYDECEKRDPAMGEKGAKFFKAALGTIGGLSTPVWTRYLNDKFGVQTPSTSSNPDDKRDLSALQEFSALAKRGAFDFE